MKALLIAALMMSLALLMPGSAAALADPDTIRIDQASSYSNVAVAGDRFFLVEYTLLYNTPPAESITQGWLGRLLDVGGTGQIASVQPFSGADIPDLGYSSGAYGFYFADAPAITGTLRVTLEGNPTLSPSPAGIFSESITVRNPGDLAPDLRTMALKFEEIWDVDLVSPVLGGVNRFTSAGEHYFSSALPNLRQVAPGMFNTQSVNVDVPSRDLDNAYSDERQSLFDGTVVATGFSSLAEFLNLSETVARFIVALGMVGAVSVAVIKTPGLQNTGFASTIVIWVGYTVLMGCFWLGLVNAATLGIITVLVIVATGVIFFLQRTSA